jgi:hypothetical protein
LGSPRSVVAQQGFGSVLGDILTNTFPTWTVGLTLSYPLGTSSQETNLARAKLQYAQEETQLKDLEMQVTTQVRDAGRQVQTNQKRVDSARAARQLAERRLEAEKRNSPPAFKSVSSCSRRSAIWRRHERQKSAPLRTTTSRWWISRPFRKRPCDDCRLWTLDFGLWASAGQAC